MKKKGMILITLAGLCAVFFTPTEIVAAGKGDHTQIGKKKTTVKKGTVVKGDVRVQMEKGRKKAKKVRVAREGAAVKECKLVQKFKKQKALQHASEERLQDLLNDHGNLGISISVDEADLNGTLDVPAGTIVVTIADITERGEVWSELDRATTIFSPQIFIDKIRQGSVGSCSFIAAVVDILKVNPKLITGMMKGTDDTVIVRFFHEEERQTVADYYEIRKTLPSINVSTDGYDQWLPLLEKAWLFHANKYRYKITTKGISKRTYSQFKGCFDLITMFLLLGGEPQCYGITPDFSTTQSEEYSDSAKAFYKILKEEQRRGYIHTFVAINIGSEFVAPNIYRNHAYSLVDVFDEKLPNGKRFLGVKLRNPHGMTVPCQRMIGKSWVLRSETNDPENGVFVLDINQAMRCFNLVTTCDLTQLITQNDTSEMIPPTNDEEVYTRNRWDSTSSEAFDDIPVHHWDDTSNEASDKISVHRWDDTSSESSGDLAEIANDDVCSVTSDHPFLDPAVEV